VIVPDEVKDGVAARVLGLSDLLVFAVVEAAASYWDAPGVDHRDFGLQSGGGDVLVFGGSNRLVWTPSRGFVPDRALCSAAFLKNYAAVGPLPGAARSGLGGLLRR